MSAESLRNNAATAELLDQFCRELVETGQRQVKLAFDDPSMREAHKHRLSHLDRATFSRRKQLLGTLLTSDRY